LRYLAEFGVTVINFVPSMLSVFLEFLARKPAHLPRLRYLCCAGEILSGNVIKRARNLLGSGVKIANQYGPTETSYASACPEVGNGDSVSIGRPMDHTVFYILDRHRRLLPRGVRGEMYIGGAGLACGYISNEALTCERFVASSFVPNETLYRTGDYGRWLADGNLEFLGREDSQVKIRGFRVELGEIERVLERNPAVNQAIALVKDGSLTGYLHCSEAVDIPVLRRWLSEMLPAWMIPTEFIFLERMPLTPNGKVDKAALLSLPDRAGKSSIAAQGLTTTESRLAQAWQDTLGNKPIGPEEDFFEVGGDSLKATSLALAIEDAFNVELPLGELYKFRTLKEQALLVEQQRAKPREGVVLLRRGTKTERTIFFVHGGSGSIGGYVNLFRNPAVSLDEDVTAYAIRYDRMKTCAPIEESIESVALDYLARIRRVQREGPYNLAAWCIGAQLITELALLLEAERLDVARLIFFNSIAPREWENIEPFNLEREKRFGADLLGEEGPGRLSDVRSIQEVWERVLAYAEAHPGDVQSRLPADWLASIPDFRRLQIGEVLYFFNCMRGLHLARAAYRPRRKVRAQCYFVNPEKDRTIPIHLKEANIQAWSMYFEKPIKILCVRGDEHSVFDQDIDDTIQAINSALRS
jgi:thioesterase domain-containing protein/acyl carrier protein